MILTWNPPNLGTPIIFSKSATDYRLLKKYDGFASIPGEHIYADRAPMRHGKRRKYTTLTTRTVSFDIIVQSANLDAQRALVAALAASFNPLDGTGILQYEMEDGTVYYLNCIGVTGNPILSDDKSQTHQRATIQLIADEDPFWHAGSPSIIYLDPNPANFFPFPSGTGTWPFTLSSSNKTRTATVLGSVNAPIIVVFTGPMTNPSLVVTKSINGVDVTETLSFTMTLNASETLTVNTAPDILTAVYSVGTENAHKYMDTTAKFWQLGRGINTVTLDPATSSTGSSASVTWSDRFVGV
jgi:hypothetical protein